VGPGPALGTPLYMSPEQWRGEPAGPASDLSAMCAFFFAIGALQYFKARQSAGEPLAEVLAQFERVALPAGYWQQRVRERVRLEVETSR
jgi:serine/threonine protein kinase